jgi:hypothetical protein
MEATVQARVCDLECGRPAVSAINWKGSQGTIQNDLCKEHLGMLARNGHAPRRGRQPGAKATTKKTTRRKSPAKKVAVKA